MTKRNSSYFEAIAKKTMVAVERSRGVGLIDSQLFYLVQAEIHEAYVTGYDDASRSLKLSKGATNNEVK